MKRSVELYHPEDQALLPPSARNVHVVHLLRDGRPVSRIVYDCDFPASTIRGDGARLDRTAPLPWEGLGS